MHSLVQCEILLQKSQNITTCALFYYLFILYNYIVIIKLKINVL